MNFPARDLTLQYVSSSYKDVVQQYSPAGSLSYLLDGTGEEILSINTSSIGYPIVTHNETIESASYSSYSSLAEDASFALDAGTATTALFSYTSSVATISETSITSSYTSGSTSVIDTLNVGRAQFNWANFITTNIYDWVNVWYNGWYGHMFTNGYGTPSGYIGGNGMAVPPSSQFLFQDTVPGHVLQYHYDAGVGRIGSASVKITNGGSGLGSLTVDNLSVTGLLNAAQISGSQICITSSQLIVADNILTLNALTPHLRYAGIEMYDSGSTGNVASFLWDGDSNYFILSSSDAGYSRKLVTGPDNEQDLTVNYIPLATGSNGLVNSIISQSGSNVVISSNNTSSLIIPNGGIALGMNGVNMEADGTGAIRFGILSQASPYGTAIGYNSDGRQGGVSIGGNSIAYNHGNVIGRSVASNYGIAMGDDAAGNDYGVSLGSLSRGQNYGVGIGYNAFGYGIGNIALGYNSYVLYGVTGSAAIGYNSYAYESNQIVLGDSSSIKNTLLFGNVNVSNNNGISCLYVSSSGNVGIDNKTPSYKLDVNGNLRVTGNNNYIGYGDYTGQMVLGLGGFIRYTGYAANSNPVYFYHDGGGDFAFDGVNGEKMRIKGISGNVGIGTNNPSYTLQVNGSFAASTKSFITKNQAGKGYIQHGCLEGPENGVYLRGETDEPEIILPDYWTWLVHENSVTVILTPIGKFRKLYIKSKNNKIVKIGGNKNVFGKKYSYSYVIYGERKDVKKLTVRVDL